MPDYISIAPRCDFEDSSETDLMRALKFYIDSGNLQKAALCIEKAISIAPSSQALCLKLECLVQVAKTLNTAESSPTGGLQEAIQNAKSTTGFDPMQFCYLVVGTINTFHGFFVQAERALGDEATDTSPDTAQLQHSCSLGIYAEPGRLDSCLMAALLLLNAVVPGADAAKCFPAFVASFLRIFTLLFKQDARFQQKETAYEMKFPLSRLDQRILQHF